MGGATVSGLNILKAINKSKYEVIVYCNVTLNSREAYNLFISEGFDVIRANKSPISYKHYSGAEHFALSITSLINIIQIIFDLKKIKKKIEHFNPDIIIINSMTLFWISILAKKNTEIIMFFRETFVNGIFGLRKEIIKKVIEKYVNKIAFISNFDSEAYGYSLCKKFVIYNTYDVNLTGKSDQSLIKKELGLPKATKYILFVGGFFKLKGAHLLIEAASKIKTKDVKFLFLGAKIQELKIRNYKSSIFKIKQLINNNYQKKCINLIRKLKLDNKILLYPQVSNISDFLKASEMLVYPMTSPHQSRPIIEAGFYKIPVIVNNFENISEIVNEENGFLFKNGDSNDLAHKIDFVLNNKSIVNVKVEKNYLLVNKNHSFNDYKLNIYKLLLDNYSS